jgi:hypothetical protein
MTEYLLNNLLFEFNQIFESSWSTLLLAEKLCDWFDAEEVKRTSGSNYVALGIADCF